MIPDPGATSLDDAGGYRLLQILMTGRALLCVDSIGHRVVLKQMEDDCLPGNKLHPQIRDRLLRVREIAHPRVATLRTVERWDGAVWLVWAYLDGQAFEHLETISLSLMAAVAIAVDALHRAGITHGNLHGQNIIVTPDHQVWLTDVSPYLYTDPSADVAAVKELLMLAAERLPMQQVAAAKGLLREARNLKQLSHELSALEAGPPITSGPVSLASKRRYRLTSVLAAASVAALGLECWLTLHAYLSRTISTAPIVFPSLRP